MKRETQINAINADLFTSALTCINLRLKYISLQGYSQITCLRLLLHLLLHEST